MTAPGSGPLRYDQLGVIGGNLRDLIEGPEQDKPAETGPGAARTPSRGRARARGIPANLTEEDRAAILAGRDEGLSRNAIAKRVGRSRDTVSAVIADAGQSFDRAQTAAATAAAETDRRAQRVTASGRLLDALDAVTDRLTTRSGDLTPYEVASLARASVDLSNAHGRLIDTDRGEPDDSVQSAGVVLDAFARALRAKYRDEGDGYDIGDHVPSLAAVPETGA